MANPPNQPTPEQLKAAEAEAKAKAEAEAKAKAPKPKQKTVVTLLTTVEKDAAGKDVTRPPGKYAFDEDTADEMLARGQARLPKSRTDDE